MDLGPIDRSFWDSAKVLFQGTAQIQRFDSSWKFIDTSRQVPHTGYLLLVGLAKSVVAGLLSYANKSWVLLGGLTQPLFAGGALTARKRAAEASAEAARVQNKSVVLTAFQNVADTLYALETDGAFARRDTRCQGGKSSIRRTHSASVGDVLHLPSCIFRGPAVLPSGATCACSQQCHVS